MAAVRLARPADVPALVRLSRALFAEDSGTRDPYVDQGWPARGAADYFATCTTWVAQVGGDLVGYLSATLRQPDGVRPVTVADLSSLYVTPEQRDAGVGAALVDAFVAWARDSGADLMGVTAYAANERAIAFYRRHGFAPLEVRLERPTR